MIEHRSSYRGTVKGIHEDYEDASTVRLEIEDLSPKPKAKKGMPSPAYPSTKSHTVSKEVAQALRIGDTVICETSIRKTGRASAKVGNPHPKKDGY